MNFSFLRFTGAKYYYIQDIEDNFLLYIIQFIYRALLSTPKKTCFILCSSLNRFTIEQEHEFKYEYSRQVKNSRKGVNRSLS